MRLPLVLSVAAFAWSSVATPAPSADTCEAVVRAFNQAVDDQYQGNLDAVIWPDGYTRWPSDSRNRPWSSVKLLGPHPKYRTFIRELRVLADSSTRRVLLTKEITLSLSTGMGQYTGDYSVTKVRYTCLKRGGQWRIFSHDVTSRNDFMNERAAREWRRTRGSASGT